ncbi:MAG: hypothetical protein AAF352_00975 [Pseudomonadota bacterium]
MQIDDFPIDDCVGGLLMHSLAIAKRKWRKGFCIDDDLIMYAKTHDVQTLFIAKLSENDVGEDTAADTAARWLATDNIRFTQGHTGRVNLLATCDGLLD